MVARRKQVTKLTLYGLVVFMVIRVLIQITHLPSYLSTNIKNVIYNESPIRQTVLRDIVAMWSANQYMSLDSKQATNTFHANSSKKFYDQFRNNNISTLSYKHFSSKKAPEFEINQIFDTVNISNTVVKKKISSPVPIKNKPIEDNPIYLCKRNKELKLPSCSKLIAGNESEQVYARQFTKYCRKEVPNNEDFISTISNCEDYRKAQNYIMNISEEETKFPLAFGIMIYKDVNQVEQLLKAIYRPHNHYCIHVDAKADLDVQHAIKNITRCLKNVKMASRSITVEWGKFSVLESELICMRDLLNYKDWKYFINLTGQEYPLKTNLQIVKILKMFHGANSVDTDADRPIWRARWRKRGHPPHGIKPRKGNIHVVLNRQFVNYTINNPVSKDFIKWLNSTLIPDETLFASLNHNPQLGIPGSYTGNQNMSNWEIKPYISRFKIWNHSQNKYFQLPCKGKWVRNICIFGYKDLPSLTNRVELFANKFHWNYQSITLDCMQEWYRNQVQMEVNNPHQMLINETYYRNIPYLKDTINLPTEKTTEEFIYQNGHNTSHTTPKF